MNIEDLSPNYIMPDNEIWLLRLIPLEENYENTILWEKEKDIDGTPIPGETITQARDRQFYWFTHTKDAMRITSTTYQREGRKYVKVDKPIKDLIGYNYIVFRNIGLVNGVNKYENKYYYGFITKYEYLNDRVTIIHYSIDLLQTFNFDYDVDQCFVEREHSSTDKIGEHLLDEKLETGELISNSNYECLCKDSNDNLISLFNTSEWLVVVAATFRLEYDDTTQAYKLSNFPGRLTNGVYNAVCYNVFNPRNVVEQGLLQTFFRLVADNNQESGIVSVFTMPSALCTYDFTNPQEQYKAKSYFWDIPIDNEFGTTIIKEWYYSYKTESGIIAYKKPSNKKLYTYPFTKLIIYNGAGDVGEYKFENFSEINDMEGNKFIRFTIYSATSPNPEITCVPNYYKGIPTNFLEKLNLNHFPQCAYAIDSYRAWLAQNKYKMGIELGASGMAFAAGTITADPFLAMYGATSLFSKTIQYVGESKQHEILPPQTKGNISPYLSVADSEIGYKAYSFRVKDEYAAIIDNYFSLYGYSTNALKIPNRNVRENWCYCKTSGCRLTGAIPGDVDKKICSIYDNGVRFWKDPNNIGRYNTLTNRCIAELNVSNSSINPNQEVGNNEGQEQ